MLKGDKYNGFFFLNEESEGPNIWDQDGENQYLSG